MPTSASHLRKLGIPLLLITIVFIICLPNAYPQSPPCIALVTDLEGTIMVRRAGKIDFEKGVWGMQLYSGDQLKTPDNSQVSLLFQNSNLITLGPNSSLTVADNPSAGTLRSLKSVSPNLSTTLSLLIFHESRNGEAGALAGLRAGTSSGDITLVTPRSLRIKSSRPSFEWGSKQKYESFKIVLLTDTGIVWTRKSSTNRMGYPDEVPALEQGKQYFWHVEGESLFETVKSLSVGFTVLLPEELKVVQEQELRLKQAVGSTAESGSLSFLLGTFYDQQGLWEDAISQFARIASKNPDAPLPHEILGRLYEKVGLKDEAIKELQKAVTLSQERL